MSGRLDGIWRTAEAPSFPRHLDHTGAENEPSGYPCRYAHYRQFLAEYSPSGIRLAKVADAGGPAVGPPGTPPAANPIGNHALSADDTAVSISGCVVASDMCSS